MPEDNRRNNEERRDELRNVERHYDRLNRIRRDALEESQLHHRNFTDQVISHQEEIEDSVEESYDSYKKGAKKASKEGSKSFMDMAGSVGGSVDSIKSSVDGLVKTSQKGFRTLARETRLTFDEVVDQTKAVRLEAFRLNKEFGMLYDTGEIEAFTQQFRELGVRSTGYLEGMTQSMMRLEALFPGASGQLSQMTADFHYLHDEANEAIAGVTDTMVGLTDETLHVRSDKVLGELDRHFRRTMAAVQGDTEAAGDQLESMAEAVGTVEHAFAGLGGVSEMVLDDMHAIGTRAIGDIAQDTELLMRQTMMMGQDVFDLHEQMLSPDFDARDMTDEWITGITDFMRRSADMPQVFQRQLLSEMIPDDELAIELMGMDPDQAEKRMHEARKSQDERQENLAQRIEEANLTADVDYWKRQLEQNEAIASFSIEMSAKLEDWFGEGGSLKQMVGNIESLMGWQVKLQGITATKSAVSAAGGSMKNWVASVGGLKKAGAIVSPGIMAALPGALIGAGLFEIGRRALNALEAEADAQQRLTDEMGQQQKLFEKNLITQEEFSHNIEELRKAQDYHDRGILEMTADGFRQAFLGEDTRYVPELKGMPGSQGGGISSPFGFRTAGGRTEFHEGIDIPGAFSIPAIGSGRITRTGRGYNQGRGNFINQRIGGGAEAHYWHLNKLGVRAGQSVRAGQFLGKSGNTGRSFGDHLHLGIYKDGRYIDPINYLKSGKVNYISDPVGFGGGIAYSRPSGSYGAGVEIDIGSVVSAVGTMNENLGNKLDRIDRRLEYLLERQRGRSRGWTPSEKAMAGI